MIIKRDRAAREPAGDFHAYDSFVGAAFGVDRSKVKLVFVDRFAGATFNIDFATARCVLVTYHGVIGKAVEDRVHIVCIARVDVALNNWR